MWQADGAERFACKNINGHVYTEMYEPGRNWSFVTFPTLSRFGSAEPDERLSSFFSNSEAGGVFVINVNVRFL